MSDRNKFLFNGKLAEKDSTGTEHLMVNQENIQAGSDMTVETDGDNVVISPNLGITVKDGLLCAVFEVED